MKRMNPAEINAAANKLINYITCLYGANNINKLTTDVRRKLLARKRSQSNEQVTNISENKN